MQGSETDIVHKVLLLAVLNELNKRTIIVIIIIIIIRAG